MTSVIVAFLALIVLWLFASPRKSRLPAGGPFMAIISRVIDGDTVDAVAGNGSKIRVRLAGIDCPEIAVFDARKATFVKAGQPGADAAKKFTARMIGGKRVRLEVNGRDRHGRILAFIFIGPINLNVALVQAGLAEVFRTGELGRYRKGLFAAEKEAKRRGRGIWGLKTYESPNSFRKAALAA